MVLGAIMSREILDIQENLEGLETLQAKSREAWHTIYKHTRTCTYIRMHVRVCFII